MHKYLCGLMIAGFAAVWSADAETVIDPGEIAGEQWYGLYMTGQKAGYAVNKLSVEDDGSVVFIQDASFKLNMVGMKQDMRIFSRRTYGPDGLLAHIESQVDDIAGTSIFRVTSEGDELKVESIVGGHSKTSTVPHPGETLQDALQGVALVMGEPVIGKTMSYSLFEPMYQRSLGATSEIIGVEERVLEGVPVQVYKISTLIELLQLNTISFVTGDGVSLEDQIGGMFTMRLEPEEVAKDVQYQNDVIVSNAARIDEPIMKPRERDALDLTICGPLTDAHLFTDGRQSIRPEGDCFDFTGRRLDPASISTITLPIDDETEHPSLVVKAR